MKLMSEKGNFRHLISTTNFPGELMLSAPSSHICYQVNIWVELVNNSVVSISTKESRYIYSKIYYIFILYTLKFVSLSQVNRTKVKSFIELVSMTHHEFWLRNGIGIIGLWKKYILLYE